MKTLDHFFDILTAQENDPLKHKGQFINFHNTKRINWNNRRNYGL